MRRSYYLFNPMELSRKDNTLKLTPISEDGTPSTPKYIPVIDVDDIYIFGNLDINAATLNFLGKEGIALHFFDYYEHYTGSFAPKEYLLAGKMLIQQTKFYGLKKKRLEIAKKFIVGASHNILKNVKYYENRGKELEDLRLTMETLSYNVPNSESIEELMGIEGNIRQNYYKAFDLMINDFEMSGRSKQPPKNEINALVSFGNMLCYTTVLSQIYHTQLNPTISYLHEPGTRRFSLALDIAEIFKPILVDRVIFNVLNKKIIQKNDFDIQLNGCKIKESAKKSFIKAYEDRLNETIKHRTLGRSVSYKYLIRLECYKLAKHLLEIEEYKPLKMWW